MRQIKFRAWDSQEKEFLTHDECCTVLSESMKGNVYTAERFVMQQFTGLLDKAGEDIFEGDIILAHEAGKNFPLKWVVVYNDEACGLMLRWSGRYIANESGFYDIKIDSRNHTVFEVIGNIYENPSLIN